MSGTHMRVLVIEDNPGDARLAEVALVEALGSRVSIQFADTLSGGMARISESSVDVILLDLGLPDAAGLDGVARLRKEAPSVPIVVLTVSREEPVALGAVAAGAQDYVVKGSLDPEVLVRTLRYAIDRHRMLVEVAEAHAAAETGLVEAKRAYEGERLAVERLETLDRLKTEFVNVVSHDLRSPLTVIVGFADALLNRSDSLGESERRQFLEAILRNAADIQRLLDDIVDVSQLESGNLTFEMASFDLVEVVRQVAFEAMAGSGRACVVDAPEECPRAFGDERRQRQILTNLVSNAVKFSAPEAPVNVSVVEGEKVLEVRVRDHGIGISPEDMPRLFRKFSRLRSPEGGAKAGTGLGLYICKSCIEAQGGTIRVDSRPGEGSTFAYTVPIAADP